MRIAVACDHIVTDRKNHVVEYLKEKGHEVIDCGTYNNERTHYAIYGKKAAEKVVGGQADLGVVLCGTGVGITASTAKVVGTRPTLVRDISSAVYARKHLNANILGFGGRITGVGLMENIIDAFLETKFEPTEADNKIIEKIDSINLVLSPSQLSNLGIPDEMIPSDVKDIFESDRYKMIFVNSTNEIATDELNKVIDQIEKVIKKYDKNAIMAGEGPCMKDLVNIADEDFKNVSIASIGIIFIIMLFVLKSISLPILLVSGIELAIFINMAISYYTGDVLPFVASIVIGTIQLGATIDYAILLTTKYLENRSSGLEKIPAMDHAISTSASSIFVSGMSFFAATFGVGMISKLNMIGSLCNLMSRGALISMMIVICVIPAILLVFDKVIICTTVGLKKLNVKGEC